MVLWCSLSQWSKNHQKMDTLCRLCVEVRLPEQFIGKITDPNLNILQKLIACCRWNYFEGQNNEILPQNVCTSCYQKLNECWEFAEGVAIAQNLLLTKFKCIASEPLDNSKNGALECDTMQYADVVAFDTGKILNFESEEKHDFEEIFNWIDNWNRDDNGIAQKEPEIMNAFKESQTLDTHELFETTEIPEMPETLIKEKNHFFAQRQQSTVELYDHDQNQNICTLKEPKPNNIQKPNNETNSDNLPLQNKHVNNTNEPKPSIARWLTYTIPDNNFLKLLRIEDCNEDGTVKPERISELKLDNWMIMQYQCWVCNANLSNRHSLRLHVSSEHPHEKMRNKCFLCTTTKRSYKRPSILVKHIMEYHLPHLKHW